MHDGVQQRMLSTYYTLLPYITEKIHFARSVNQFMGLILVIFFTLNLNNTKSISYIFNVNTSINRCYPFITVPNINSLIFIQILKILLFLSIIDQNP